MNVIKFIDGLYIPKLGVCIFHIQLITLYLFIKIIKMINEAQEKLTHGSKTNQETSQIKIQFLPNFIGMADKIIQSNSLDEVEKFTIYIQNLQALQQILKQIQNGKSQSLLFVTCELLLRKMQKQQKIVQKNPLLLGNQFVQIQDRQSPYEYYDTVCTFFSQFLNKYNQSLNLMQKKQIKQVIGYALDQCFTVAMEADQYNLKFIQFFVENFNPNQSLIVYQRFNIIQNQYFQYETQKLGSCFQILCEVIQRRDFLDESQQTFAQFMKRHRIFKNIYLQDISTFCIRFCKIILHKFNAEQKNNNNTSPNLKNSIVLKAICFLQKIITFNFDAVTHTNPQYTMLDNCVSSPVSTFPTYLTQFSQDYTILEVLHEAYTNFMRILKLQSIHEQEHESILQDGVYPILKMYGKLFFIKKYQLQKEQIHFILATKFKIICELVQNYFFISLVHLQYLLEIMQKTVIYENSITFDYSGVKETTLNQFQLKNQICIRFVQEIITISRLVLQDTYWKVLSECTFFTKQNQFYSEQNIRHVTLPNKTFILLKNVSEKIHLYFYNQHSSQLVFFQTIYALIGEFMKKFTIIANQLMKKIQTYEDQSTIIETMFLNLFFFIRTDPIIANISNEQILDVYRQEKYVKEFAQQLCSQIVAIQDAGSNKLLIYLFTFVIVANERMTTEDSSINQIIKNTTIYIIKSFNPNQAIWHLIKKIIIFTFSSHSKCSQLFNNKSKHTNNVQNQMITQTGNNQKSFLQMLINSTFQNFKNVLAGTSNKNFESYISLIIMISNKRKQFQAIGISLQEEVSLIEEYFSFKGQQNQLNMESSNNFYSLKYLQQSSNLIIIYLKLISSKYEADQNKKLMEKLTNLNHNLFLPFKTYNNIEGLIKYFKFMDTVIQKTLDKKIPIELVLTSLKQFQEQLKKIVKTIFKNPVFHDVFKSFMLTVMETQSIYEQYSDLKFQVQEMFYLWVKQLGKYDNSQTVLFIWAKFAQLNPLGKLLPIYEHLIKINSKNFELIVEAYCENLHRLSDDRLLFMMQCFDKKLNWLQEWWDQIILRELRPQINSQIYTKYMIKGQKKNNRNVLKLLYKVGKYDIQYDKWSANSYNFKEQFINNWQKLYF